MAWTDVALLAAHAAAILAGVLVFRAALARSLRTRPAPPVAATAAAATTAAAPAPARDYEAIVAELAELDARLAKGELDAAEHGTRRTALLAEAKRARRTG